MRIVMTVSELLSKIKKVKDEYDYLYKEYIDPETSINSRYMVSLYNPTTGKSVNGLSLEDITKEIQSINDKILSVRDRLIKLTLIKDSINSQSTITIMNGDKEEKMLVSTAILLKSPKIRNYYKEYLYKLRDSYKYGTKKLLEHTQSVMSNDKIDRYVLVKMNSLNIPNTEEAVKTNYKSFALEYREANELKILDPLLIKESIEQKIQEAEELDREIDAKLFNFNATTKIWIDIDAEGESAWGFVE